MFPARLAVGTIIMQSKLAALQAALDARRHLIDEWKTMGRPTPKELLARIDENDRHILDLRRALLAEGYCELPD
jgi:hypothetical protein